MAATRDLDGTFTFRGVLSLYFNAKNIMVIRAFRLSLDACSAPRYSCCNMCCFDWNFGRLQSHLSPEQGVCVCVCAGA